MRTTLTRRRFLERAIYTGVHELGSPLVDSNGFRKDVLGRP